MSTTRKAQSIFPDYPRPQPIVDKEGNFQPLLDLAFSSLFQALQRNFKNEGILLPPLTSAQIAQIQAIYDPTLIGMPLPPNIPDISGQTIFDSTARVPKVFIITYDGATPPNIVTAAWKTYVLI
jgi:hypothetical protein